MFFEALVKQFPIVWEANPVVGVDLIVSVISLMDEPLDVVTVKPHGCAVFRTDIEKWRALVRSV